VVSITSIPIEAGEMSPQWIAGVDLLQREKGGEEQGARKGETWFVLRGDHQAVFLHSWSSVSPMILLLFFAKNYKKIHSRCRSAPLALSPLLLRSWNYNNFFLAVEVSWPILGGEASAGAGGDP
jgi:hypothetical protein